MEKKFTRLGYVVNRSKRKLTIRTEAIPENGQFVYNSQGRKIGKIIKIYGPVSKPYVNISLFAGELRNINTVYIGGGYGRKKKK